VIPGDRDASVAIHLLPDILRAASSPSPAANEYADDLNRLRGDPAFALACVHLPNTGRDQRAAG